MSQIINVSHQIDGKIAVTSDDAQIIFKILKNNIEKSVVSVLDFSEIQTLTTSFLNEAIGSLYMIADGNTIASLVKVDAQKVSPQQYATILEVIKNARRKNGIEDESTD